MSSEMSMAEQVNEFNRRVLGIEPRIAAPMSWAEADHLRKALAEEGDELAEASVRGDFVGQIDACIDAIYFALGGLYKMGLNPDAVSRMFHEVHTANMEKKLGVVASRGDGTVPDAIKPGGWTPPEDRIRKVLDRYVEMQSAVNAAVQSGEAA